MRPVVRVVCAVFLLIALLQANTAWAQNSCTAQTCGTYLPSGTLAQSCTCYGGTPGCCRFASGCSCEHDCGTYGDCCVGYEAVCNVPNVDTVTPASVATSGGSTLTLAGARFGATAGSVSFGGKACSVTGWSNASVSCLAPSGAGTALDVQLTRADGKTSNSLKANYDAPLISSVSPGSVPTSGGTVILSGSNFGASAASVRMNGTELLSVSNATHSTLNVTVPAGIGTSHPLTVSAGGQTSNAIMLDYAAPSVSQLSPSAVVAGTAITLTGANFGPASAPAPTVSIGGVACANVQRVIEHSRLTCTAPTGGGTPSLVVALGGQLSSAVPAPYAAPAITNVSPSSIPTSGGVPLTLTGSNLGAPGLAVTVGGQTCPLQQQSDSQVRCTAPAGSGASVPVVATVDAQSSAAATVSYDAPVLTGLTPASGATTGGATLTLTGSNFGPSGAATVRIGGRLCVPISQSHSSLLCAAPAGDGASNPVVLTVGGQTSNSLSYAYAPPALSGLSPTSGPTSGGTLLTLSGSNFGVSPATVSVGASSCPVVTQSHSQVVCTTPAGSGLAHAVRVTVGGQSSSEQVAFNYNGPSIAQLVPTSGPTAGGTPLTLTGSNFGASGANVTVGGVVCPVVTQSHSQIVCTSPGGSGVSKPVVVMVAGQTSSALSFSYDAPALTQVSPVSGPTRGGVTLTLSGSNFSTAGGSVTVAGAACPITAQSHTQVLCVLPEGEGAARDVVFSLGGRSSNAGSFTYAAPALSGGLVPSAAPNTGGNLLHLQGTNFGLSPSVTVGSAACAVLKRSHEELLCVLPAASSGNANVVLSAGGQSSAPATFTFFDSCSSLPEGSACETGSPCRGQGVCHGGVCVNAPEANEGASCDDGNPCTTATVCAQGECGAGPAQAEGQPCVGNNACTHAGTCLAGVCTGSSAREGASCDDGAPSTVGDTCQLGLCVGTLAGGRPDSGTSDGGDVGPDAGDAPDAGEGVPDAGAASGEEPQGCACNTFGSAQVAWFALLLGVLGHRSIRARKKK